MKFDESKHPRQKGKFVKKTGARDSPMQRLDMYGNEKHGDTKVDSIAKQNDMTTAQKIASVKIEKGKDSILPMLNESDLHKIGASTNKSV